MMPVSESSDKQSVTTRGLVDASWHSIRIAYFRAENKASLFADRQQLPFSFPCLLSFPCCHPFLSKVVQQLVSPSQCS